MTSTNLLETNTVNLNELLSNGRRYIVPRFQRDYAWGEDEWEALWEDIESLAESNEPHYMGTVVLQTRTNNRQFIVVDGQQRFATFSIIILACVKLIDELIVQNIDKDANLERKTILMQTYIGSKDAASLNYSNKLELSPRDNPFYATTLVRLREPINPKRLVPNEKRLWSASEFFHGKLKEYFRNSTGLNGESIADFVTSALAEKLVFIQITVADQLNAYTVFETLNARGVSLSTTDLLKNYLLSLMSESETDQLIAMEQWDRLIDTVTPMKFPQFLLYFWNSRHKSIRASSLYKNLRRSVNTKQEAFLLIDQLEESAGIYIALKDADDILWRGHNDIQQNIDLLKLFGVNTCFPLLMNTHKFCSINDFEKVLRACMVISFRSNVIANQSTNKQGDNYNAIALKIFQENVPNRSSAIIGELESLYLSDEEFRSDFATKSIPTRGTIKKKLIRYILSALESHNSGQGYLDVSSDVTIEHIMPENLSESWDIPVEEHKDFVYRLGNYALLSGRPNRDAGNLDFESKKSFYEASSFEITRVLQDWEYWSHEEIRDRQRRMSRAATAIWRISQLS